MKRPTVKSGLPLLIALGAGCTTTSADFGSAPGGASPVTFSWMSTGAVFGSMTAAKSDGKTFPEQFFRTDRTKDCMAGR